MDPKLLDPFMDFEKSDEPSDRRMTSESRFFQPTTGGGDNRQLSYFELARLMDRASRRFTSLIRTELVRSGFDDIGAAQVMILLVIDNSEITVRELLDRGHYMGSNISYYLKRLTDGDYIHRIASRNDKRSAFLKLTSKGSELCAGLRRATDTYERVMAHDAESKRNLRITFRALHHLEIVWSNAAR